MKTKTQLLAGAALGLIVTMAASASAEAAPKHHKHAKGSSEASLAAQVRALNAKVESLEATLQAQAANQQQVQAQAQASAAQAAQAQAQAQAAQAKLDEQIQQIPAQVHTQVVANRPKPGWEANTQVTGRMYYDLSHVEQDRDGQRVAPSGTGFDIKRFYVGIDHKFNDVFSANITTDVQYNSAESLTQIYIKKAYLQAKVNDAFIVRLGSADTPWVPFVEDVYGYRFVENIMIDRDKFGTSADWGAHVLGKVGIFNYQVSVVDGAGYKNPVRTKTMDVEGRISTNLDGVVLAVGGYYGKLGKSVEGGPPTHHAASRFDALAAYVQPKFRIGVEYFKANDWNNVTTVASDDASGYSIFGNYNFTPKISLFGRWDHVDPSNKLNSRLKDQYYNFGLNFEPVKIVDLALVYKHDSVEHGLLSTSNGTIGSPLLLTGKGDYNEIGLFGQVRW